MKIVNSNPHFSVNEYGDVYWTKTGTKLKPFIDKDGYYRISYRFKNKTYHIAPHRAVAEMYVKNPKPNKYKIVNHKNSVRTDNHYKNVEWATNKINTNHAHLRDRFDNIKGEKHSQAVLKEDQVREICLFLSQGKGVTEISLLVKQPKHRIDNIKTGKCWRTIALEYGLKLPPAKTKQGIEWLLKEKASLGISEEDLKKDYFVE